SVTDPELVAIVHHDDAVRTGRIGVEGVADEGRRAGQPRLERVGRGVEDIDRLVRTVCEVVRLTGSLDEADVEALQRHAAGREIDEGDLLIRSCGVVGERWSS